MRFLLKLAAGFFLVRWAAGEAAAYGARRRRAPGPAPIDSPPSTL
jgi:hypothetical protein